MKKNLTTLLLFAYISLLGQSGIQFIHDEYATALAQSVIENKLIMLDAYTTWCGPCKMMSSNTFMDNETASYYNDKFVNLKLDMEKGTNPALGIKYNVRAYPTIIFIDANENVIYKSVGYIDASTFLDLGKDVISGKKNLPALIQKYKTGPKTDTLLYEIAKAKTSMMDAEATKFAEEYLKTQKDWKTEKNQELIIMNSGDIQSKLFAYVVKNQDHFIKQYGTSVISRTIENAMTKFLYTQPSPEISKVKKLYKLVYPNDADKKLGQYKMSIARNKGDRDTYAKEAAKYFSTFNKDAEEMNEAALVFYQVVENPKLLQKAIDWTQKTLKIQENNDYQNTLVALYIKTKQLDLASKSLIKSFEYSKKNQLENPFGEELKLIIEKNKTTIQNPTK